MIKKQTKRISKKSLPQTMTTLETFFHSSAPLSTNPVSLLGLNKNWVYICNNKNAQVVASCPLKLYANVSKTSLKDINFRHKLLNTNKKQYVLNNVSHKYINEGSEYVEITEHPFLDLVYSVNSIMDNFSLFEITEGYMGLLGNAYWQIIKDKSGMPKEIKVLPAEYICAILDSNNNIIAYEQKEPSQNTPQRFAVEDVIHFRQPVAGAFKRSIVSTQSLVGIYGMGHLESCIEEAGLLDSINKYERSMSDNRARPDLIVKYKNGKLQQKTQQELVRMWNRVFKGAQNSGKIQILDEDFEVIQLGFAPKDLEFDKGKTYLKMVICDAFGVPIDLVDTQNSNRATASVSENQYKKYTILPKLKRYQECITQKLLPLYDDNLFVMFDNPVEEDRQLLSVELNSYVSSGIMSKNEARERLGLEPIEEDDSQNNNNLQGANDEA